MKVLPLNICHFTGHLQACHPDLSRLIVCIDKMYHMNILLNFFYLNAYTLAFHTQDFQINITLSGLLIVRDVILHNRPQIASDCTIHEKSHNL